MILFNARPKVRYASNSPLSLAVLSVGQQNEMRLRGRRCGNKEKANRACHQEHGSKGLGRKRTRDYAGFK